MRRFHSDWFTIVASDFFSNCFAAIIVLDAVTPKEIAVVVGTVSFQIEYALGESYRCNDPSDSSAVVLWLPDDEGQAFSSIDSPDVQANREGDKCVISGALEGVTLSGQPRALTVIIADYPGVAPTEGVHVTLSSYEVDIPKDSCSSVGLCRWPSESRQ